MEKEISPLENELNEKIKKEREAEAVAKKAFENADNEYKAAMQKEQQALTELNQIKAESEKYKVDELTKEKENKEKEKKSPQDEINTFKNSLNDKKK